MKRSYNRFIYILCGILCLITTANLRAEEHTTMGRDFWLSFGRMAHYAEPNYPYADEFPMSRYVPQLRVSATKAARVTITFTELGTSMIVDLQAGETKTILLNSEQKMATYSVSTGTTRKSIHIVSTEPVSVYALSQARATTDATNVLPVVALGTNYYHMSYKPLAVNTGNHSDGFTIVAVENHTTIRNGRTNQVLATLQQGQVYSYYTNVSGVEDLTGTYIASDKPVAYFVTNSGVNIPENIAAADGLYQQMMPVSSWGNTFLVPVTIQGKERVRIIASEGGTNVVVDGSHRVVTGSLNSMTTGTFAELEITSGCFISSNKAIGICSYLVGSRYIGGLYSPYGDPAMTWIPPLQQAVDTISIAPFIPGYTLLQHHYAVVITSTANKAETQIKNGSGIYVPLTGVTWFDKGGYSYCSKLLYDVDTPSGGTMNYSFTNPGGVIVLGYGLGNTGAESGESYYYLAGAATRRINPSFYVNDVHYADMSGRVLCGPDIHVKASIYSRALNDFFVKWYLNGTEIHTGKNLEEWDMELPAGTHKIRMEVKNYLEEVEVCETEFTVNLVTITNPSSEPIYVGDTRQLTGKGFPANLTGVWVSSTPNVATIDQTGKLTATGVGTTDIIYIYNGCATSLSLNIEARVIVNMWIGQGRGNPLFPTTEATKNLWSISANWTANRLPGEDEIVEYHPQAIDLWVDGAYTVKGIRNQTNANLVVPANRKLRLTSSYELSTSSSARVIVKAFVPTGSSTTGVNGTFITPTGLRTTQIGSPVIIGIPVEVEFYSKAKSPAGVNNSGLMNWQYFGVPVISVTAGSALTGAAVRRYDERSFNYWVTVSGNEKLTSFRGYEVSWWETNSCNGLFKFQGELENRDNSMLLTRTSANTLFSGHHVVSNPYTAGLSIANGLDFGAALEKTVYLFHTGSSENWDNWISGGANTNLVGPGQYLAIPQNLAGTMSLGSMQGFVVKIKDGLTGTMTERTLKFKYSGTGDNVETRSGSETQPERFNFTVASLSSNGKPKDCIWLFTSPEATDGFDNGYDGMKIFGSPRLSQLYAVNENGNYQIHFVNNIHSTCLAFKAEEGIRNYTLTFYHQNTDEIYKSIYLVDTKEGNREVNITANGSEYNFTGDNNVEAENRFRIRAERKDFKEDNQSDYSSRFKAYQENGILVLDNGEDINTDVMIYNMQGIVVHNRRIAANSNARIADLEAGFYLIYADYITHRVTKKILLQD